MAPIKKNTKKGSPNFARIKHQVLTIVAAIPPGYVVSYKRNGTGTAVHQWSRNPRRRFRFACVSQKDIGDWLDVMPRHVAYILAKLDPVDRVHLPWQRVIADKDPTPHPRIAIPDLPIDLPRQTRPEKHTPPGI